MKILVVDDEPVNIQLMVSFLQHEHEVITAIDGYDAIQLTKTNIPDLILLDVMMPGLNGFEVCKIIKEDPSFADIPIIFLTALDSGDAEKMGLAAGGIDFLTKPINFELLKLRVHNHLELKRKNNLVKIQRDLLKKQKQELENTLERLQQLEGIISICSYCKNIKNEDNVWEQLEKYFEEHTDALFSHGICPVCMEKEVLKLRQLSRR